MKSNNELNNWSDDKIFIERERYLKKLQYTAVIMLSIASIILMIGFVYTGRTWKAYALLSTSTMYQGVVNRDKENDSLDDTKKLMDEITNIYETSYVNDIEKEEIDEYVLNALVTAYGDRYAVYRDLADTVDSSTAIASQINGIGVLSRAVYDDYNTEYFIYIIDVYDGSPAEQAGLKIGDEVLKVNGKKLDSSKYNFNEAISDIKGEAGTAVTLTVKDVNTGKISDITVVRQRTSVNTVRYKQLTDDVGYILIRSFEMTTADEVKEALDYFSKLNISKFVFDVRDNTGGLKHTVIETLDMLVGKGVLMYELNSKGEVIDTSMSDADCIKFESVTLVNSYTASAAELFTKCLSDYDLTTTIGETTFGKGTVCTTYPLSNGGSVMVSTGKYLTKSKEDIEKKGIKPDIEMELSEEKLEIFYKLTVDEDDLIQRAIEELNN